MSETHFYQQLFRVQRLGLSWDILGCCGKLSVGVFYFSQHYPTLSNIFQQFDFAAFCQLRRPYWNVMMQELSAWTSFCHSQPTDPAAFLGLEDDMKSKFVSQSPLRVCKGRFPEIVQYIVAKGGLEESWIYIWTREFLICFVFCFPCFSGCFLAFFDVLWMLDVVLSMLLRTDQQCGVM